MLTPALAFSLVVLNASPSDAPITAKNWLTHPKVVAIRKIYSENQKLPLKEERKDFDCDGDVAELHRSVFRDSKQRIRKYIFPLASGDSGYTAEHHYDAEGRLRFIFVIAGAVTDSTMEMRVYFDERGQRIWEDSKLTQGEGWTFMTPWPEDLVVRDPQKAFQGPPREGCKPAVPHKP